MPPSNPLAGFNPQFQEALDASSAYTQSESIMAAVLIIKFIFFAVSFFFLLHGIYLVYKMGLVNEKMSFYSGMFSSKKESMRKDMILLEWEKIKNRMATMRESEYKFAIIEADKLFDILLQKMDYKGKDMNARLSQIDSAQLSSVQGVWESHKVRNMLAHDPNYQISFTDAQRIIVNYERAFAELGILD
ncbi:hypothetical protein A3C91_01720 [Candidatus Azambacteria bacterium RIFCSPHIGHO2_02_FULL_52_12]|uniref:DUF4145 domain-containing protein n=1 Tax=Candidatus Azambacteria bacterium RIFCSPLOWO2_01_FULL_46_25 TaxID=1797298 RepID=A0A1F5BVC4_9BACT|nr:MAG: hypothetical protein A3C91_01720 [Candidatus Azambacteria bacterium RIFCSPHIGHO2_02_FULL_52_12]OGD34564.1 MAG: hypothetical protein A2988_03580 [Candidatus Azambacteria bacterium RIFCSPLOWO2_01_FULL_46_25]OGD36438.1 MAG: hypothetical protein A2850_02080 [Candidatus Azambacteria bacterium RIFCSPHIGHO2_01_FULL_51_74]